MKTSLKNDEQGLGHLVLVVLLVVIVGAVGFAGWRVASKKSPTTISHTPTTVTAKPPSGDCLKKYGDKNVCSFIANFNLEHASFKADITYSSGTFTYLSDGKGDSSITYRLSGGEQTLIRQGSNVYAKNPVDGHWYKYAAGSSSTQSSNILDEVKGQVQGQLNGPGKFSFTALGKEGCGSLTCFKYQVSGLSAASTKEFIWFDTKDYRLQRLQTMAMSTTVDAVFTYQAIQIQIPTHVSEPPSGSSLSGTADMPSL